MSSVSISTKLLTILHIQNINFHLFFVFFCYTSIRWVIINAKPHVLIVLIWTGQHSFYGDRGYFSIIPFT